MGSERARCLCTHPCADFRCADDSVTNEIGDERGRVSHTGSQDKGHPMSILAVKKTANKRDTPIYGGMLSSMIFRWDGRRDLLCALPLPLIVGEMVGLSLNLREGVG